MPKNVALKVLRVEEGESMWKDSETEVDFLDFQYLISILKDLIYDDKLLPASIGVYGDWGSGKSSLMYMCKKQLEAEDPKIKCLVFNGWLFEDYDDAKTAILGTILDEIGKKKRLTKKAKEMLDGLNNSVDKFKLLQNGLKYGIDFLLTGGIGTITDLTVKSALKAATTTADLIDVEVVKAVIKDELNNKELREDISKFRNEFAALLEETKISRLVIYIDELDRCSPDTILETLEAMRLFLFSGKVAFVIGADERHIAYAVKSKFKDIEGIQIDIGKEYLEKLIQYPIRIPRLDDAETEFYIACLLLQHKLPNEKFTLIIDELNKKRHEDFLKFSIAQSVNTLPYYSEYQSEITDCIAVAKQLASILSKGLNGNPRQCKRFLNSLDMRVSIAKYKNKVLDQKILAKIMMLEYIQPNLFRKMAELSANDKLKPELISFETGKFDDAQELKLWKNEEWVRNWCAISPKLANEELALYFYFTRTALDSKLNQLGSKLSLKAQEICTKLLSKADISVAQAIKEFDSIGDAEATKVLEIVYNDMISDSKIDDSKFKAFIAWGETRETLYPEVIAYIQTMPATKIPLGAIPVIRGFADKIKKYTDIKLAIETWKSNQLLKVAIDQAFAD